MHVYFHVSSQGMDETYRMFALVHNYGAGRYIKMVSQLSENNVIALLLLLVNIAGILKIVCVLIRSIIQKPEYYSAFHMQGACTSVLAYSGLATTIQLATCVMFIYIIQ